MARWRTHLPPDVYLNARLVDRLHRSAGGAIEFRYDESWLNWEGALPISLPLPRTVTGRSIHSIDKRFNERFYLVNNAFGNCTTLSEFWTCIHDSNNVVP